MKSSIPIDFIEKEIKEYEPESSARAYCSSLRILLNRWEEKEESISIKWIEGWLKTHIPHDNDGTPYITDVYEMLADWEKENEK